MLRLFLKIIVLLVLVLIGLKVFAPDVADKVIDKVSQSTGIEKEVINNNKNLDNATDITKEGINKALDKAKDSLEVIKDKIDK